MLDINQFTTFFGAPSANALILSIRVEMSRCRAAPLAHAIWGVMKHRGAVVSGDPLRGGSCVRTSAQNASMRPSVRASATASSSTKGPRPVLMMMALRFILAMFTLLIICSVSGVSGQCSEITSLFARRSSIS